MNRTCSRPVHAFAWRAALVMLAMALWSLAASAQFPSTPTYQGRSGWCSDGRGGPLTQPSTSGQAVCNELAGMIARCIDVRATGQFVFEPGVKGPYCDLDLPYNPASGGGGGLWRAAPPNYLFVTSSCPANARVVGQACACRGMGRRLPSATFTRLGELSHMPGAACLVATRTESPAPQAPCSQ